MDDMIAFVRARLDEDEAVAQDAGGPPWDAAETTSWVHVNPQAQQNDPLRWGKLGYVATVEQDWDRRHIARHDPARVLRQTAAMRAIVDRAEFVAGYGPAIDDVRALDMTTGASAALRDVLRHLAATWADHPEYRQEWRP